MRDFFFLRIHLLQLKVGCFYFFKCEVQLILQIINFLKPYLLIFTRGANNSGGRCMSITGNISKFQIFRRHDTDKG